MKNAFVKNLVWGTVAFAVSFTLSYNLSRYLNKKFL